MLRTHSIPRLNFSTNTSHSCQYARASCILNRFSSIVVKCCRGSASQYLRILSSISHLCSGNSLFRIRYNRKERKSSNLYGMFFTYYWRDSLSSILRECSPIHNTTASLTPNPTSSDEARIFNFNPSAEGWIDILSDKDFSTKLLGINGLDSYCRGTLRAFIRKHSLQQRTLFSLLTIYVLSLLKWMKNCSPKTFSGMLKCCVQSFWMLEHLMFLLNKLIFRTLEF